MYYLLPSLLRRRERRNGREHKPDASSLALLGLHAATPSRKACFILPFDLAAHARFSSITPPPSPPRRPAASSSLLPPAHLARHHSPPADAPWCRKRSVDATNASGRAAPGEPSPTSPAPRLGGLGGGGGVPRCGCIRSSASRHLLLLPHRREGKSEGGHRPGQMTASAWSGVAKVESSRASQSATPSS